MLLMERLLTILICKFGGGLEGKLGVEVEFCLTEGLMIIRFFMNGDVLLLDMGNAHQLYVRVVIE